MFKSARRVARRWPALVLIAILLLTACSGDDDDDVQGGSSLAPTATAENPATPEPASTATSTPEPAGTPAPPEPTVTDDAPADSEVSPTEAVDPTAEPSPAETMTEAEAALAQQLLQPGDLPEGWLHAPQMIPEDATAGETGVCDQPSLANAAEWDAEAATAFAQVAQQRFVLERLGTLPEDEATAFMEQVRQAVDCEEFTDPDGISYSIAPLALPALGDEIQSFRMSGGGADYDFAYVRAGGTILLFSQAAAQGSIDSDLTVSLLEAAVARISDAE